MKAQILEVLGETGLNQPARIESALAANERIKYYLSLLQLAIARADHPEQGLDSMQRERVASGIDDRALDELLAHSQRENGHYILPGAGVVMEQIIQDFRLVAAPVLAQANSASGAFAERLERLLVKLAGAAQDVVESSTIAELTRVGAGDTDTLHQLLIDLHKALTGMQAALCEEHLDGASIYRITEADRPLIAAFMRGLNRTAPLKFNHPGLGTTVTRSGEQLVIQNDLGTTDAHVMVIHVTGLHVEITHTDVHPQRIQFLCDMLKRYEVSWEEDHNRQALSMDDGASFQLLRGRFHAKDLPELLNYLEFLASRLVFLIDWNRARKELRSFLRAQDRIALLAWAAEEEVGHRAFLDLGGAQLLNRAIEDTGSSAIHFGDRLCDVLGNAMACDFLRFVFQAAMEGLRDQQSPGLIRDRIRAGLQSHFSSEWKRLLRLIGEHAAMIFEIAALLQDGIHTLESGDHESYRQLSERARAIEHCADELVAGAREAIRKRPEYAMLFRVFETADDAADELEEVAFLMDLLVTLRPTGELLKELGRLADLLVEAAQEWVKVSSQASDTGKAGAVNEQDDIRDLLTAIDALFALEHRTDEAEREFTRSAVQNAKDFRQLHIYSRMAQSLEQACDALKWTGLLARDYLLGHEPRREGSS